MPKYAYKVKNSKGKLISGTLDARHVGDARKTLESRGYEIERLSSAGGVFSRLFNRTFRSVSKAELALFSRQIAVMFKAGVDIRRAFQVMSLQGFSPYFSEVIAQVEVDVSEGESLSRAMGRHPNVFNMLFVGMVKAGEGSGGLDKVLFQLADHLDKEVLVRHKIKSAITYPAFIFVLALGLAFIIVQHILPTFINGVFKQEGLDLPWITKSLIWVTDFLNNGSNLAYLIGGGTVFLFFLWQFSRTAQGKYQFQSILHNMPGTRRVMQILISTRFCRIFSALIESGLPLVHSLDLVSAALGDYVVAPRIEQVKNDLRDGKTLSEAFTKMDIFPPILIEFVLVGEESGRISQLLSKLGDTLEDDIDDAVHAYTSLLEPVMLLVMGSLVGYVIIAVFVPIYQLVGAF